ncbi:hypothetical protein SAMN06269117_10512 [Balnearium lithotrophicum]|uniref:SIMPL domain-containing protein n=1 Tax=Balnearium lithotrophicum TaxID=223788 RepID=A0A521BDP9_9BACT|nr:hypothetical protein [Balnearium lithotrophicum]SMO45238.1 hypothetical protein SAMN06269117_10512 [Balnearium lithotrophicum]
MKWIFIFLFSFPLSVFSAETPNKTTVIKDTVEVSKSVQPDVYSLTFKVSSRGKSEENVLKSLSTADEYIRGLNLPYSGGNFIIYPLKEWDSVRKVYRIDGFSGEVLYRFKLKNVLQQEDIFRALNMAKEKSPISYSILYSKWVVSEKKKSGALKSLKVGILNTARQEKKIFERELNKRCFIKSISFSSVNPFPILENVRAFKITAPKPKREREEIKLRARVVYICY